MKKVFPGVIVCLILCHGFVQGEVFALRSGGTVEGAIQTAYEMDQKVWNIKTPEGVLLELEHRKAVSKIYKDPSKMILSYESSVPFYENTVENHLALAEKCKTFKLNDKAELHYRQVIALDPDHAEARKQLGYSNFNGMWLTREEEREGMGYVYKDRRWITTQQAAIEEDFKQQKQDDRIWAKEIARIVEGLHGSNHRVFAKEIQAIRDDRAVGPIIKRLRDENDEDIRIVYLKALKKIGSTDALLAIAASSMFDSVEEVRITALELLKETPGVTRYYTKFLQSSNNNEINHAAAMLEKISNPAAVPELISALITTHRETITDGGEGQYRPSFDNRTGSMGLTVGSSTKAIDNHVRNQSVLRALKRITGEDFGFDIDRWREWYKNQRRITNYSSRRGGMD